MHTPSDCYHVTSQDLLARIAEEGLRGGTYLATDPAISDYYAETIEDENKTPVRLRVQIGDLDPQSMSPDIPGLQEPICSVLRNSESEIWEEWTASEKDAWDSIRIVGTFRYDAVIPPGLILVDELDETISLEDFVSRGAPSPATRI